MSDKNWRTETNGADYFGNQKKRAELADRRPVPRKPSDIGLGPGISANAVRITDFNDTLATYDGFFSAGAGALNAPTVDDEFVGSVTSDSTLGGVQLFTALATEILYKRVFQRNPADPSTIYWGDWLNLGTGTVGGVVDSIIAGAGIDVDSTDPANPIVSTLITTKGDLLVGDGVDSAVRFPVGDDGFRLVADSTTVEGVTWTPPEEADLSDVTDRFINTDSYVATGPGDFDWALSYEPDPGSLHVHWGALNLPIADLPLVGNVLTVPDPDSLFRDGHIFTCEYAVRRDAPLIVIPTPTTGNLVDFEEAGWKWLQILSTDNTDYSATSFDDSSWASAPAAFGFQATTGNSANPDWPLPSTDWDVGSRMWARKTFTATAGVDILCNLRVDRSYRFYLNGILHVIGTPTSVDSSFVIPGYKVLATNKIAFQVTDTFTIGGSCYFDCEMIQ